MQRKLGDAHFMLVWKDILGSFFENTIAKVNKKLARQRVAPANQTKERAKTKSSWISPFFVNSGVFFLLGKQARFTLNFCSGLPLRKVHELAFLWFGLPRPLLMQGNENLTKTLYCRTEIVSTRLQHELRKKSWISSQVSAERAILD